MSHDMVAVTMLGTSPVLSGAESAIALAVAGVLTGIVAALMSRKERC